MAEERYNNLVVPDHEIDDENKQGMYCSAVAEKLCQRIDCYECLFYIENLNKFKDWLEENKQ